MHTTSASLLMRLKQPGQAEAWARFVRLYWPMLYAWARRMGLQDADAIDLVQEVFATLLRKLPEFDYDDHKSFRSWLWTVTRNKWKEKRRLKQLPIEHDAKPDRLLAPEADKLEEEDFQRHLLLELLPSFESHFQPVTWRAFWEYVVNGRSPADVAAELNISPDSVYQAKVRVLSRLHRTLGDLM